MYKLAIVAVLLALTSAVPSRVHFQDTKSVLAEIDKDIFGNTFISAIALNMAAQNPVEEITLLIDEILQQLDKDQSAADAKNRTDQAVCDETIAGFNAQIAEHTETIATLEKAIADNTEIVEQATVDLDQANKDYDETIDAITAGTEQREAEHAKWAAEDYQNSIEIATLEEGVKLIQHMVHGIAFAQIKVRYDKVLDKLRDSDSKRSTLYKPLITSLTQLATKLNYEDVMKILDLLNGIRAGIVEEQEAARMAEEKAQADWEVLLAHLENQKQSLADKRARLTALIASTELLLEQLSGSLANHRVELENLQQSLAAQQAWCDEQSNTYTTQSSEREREIAILNKLQEHMAEKFGAISDYVESREGGEF